MLVAILNLMDCAQTYGPVYFYLAILLIIQLMYMAYHKLVYTFAMPDYGPTPNYYIIYKVRYIF